MKKNELINLRRLVKAEIERRQRINQYLDNEVVLEYLRFIGEDTNKKNLENIRGMLKGILRNFEVKETNGIYVCTKAYDEDNSAPILYYCRPDSKYGAFYKSYVDIESREEVSTRTIYGPSISDFERSHIVLNPYNASYRDEKIEANGYEDVRLDFFEECYKSSQYEAVQKVLKKYPRIGSYK
jgi:hypothetical protein